ncbi:hypothetical protein B0H17DRAFT_1097252, partial [Mycena rosella]
VSPTGTGFRWLAGDITVTACPDVGAETVHRPAVLFLQCVSFIISGSTYGGIPVYLPFSPPCAPFHFVDTSLGWARNPSCSLAVGPGLATLESTKRTKICLCTP